MLEEEKIVEPSRFHSNKKNDRSLGSIPGIGEIKNIDISTQEQGMKWQIIFSSLHLEIRVTRFRLGDEGSGWRRYKNMWLNHPMRGELGAANAIPRTGYSWRSHNKYVASSMMHHAVDHHT